MGLGAGPKPTHGCPDAAVVMKLTGRPTEYTEHMAEKICSGIAGGKSLVTILAADNMPGYSTVMQWLRKFPSFADIYAGAREDMGDYDADKVNEIARRVVEDGLDPAAARVAIDAHKWSAGKRKPRVYGDRLGLHGVEDAPPIRTSTALDVSGLSLEQLDVLRVALPKVVSGKDDPE